MATSHLLLISGSGGGRPGDDRETSPAVDGSGHFSA